MDKLFDITCVIGSIYDNPDAEFSPYEAAFHLIGMHGADGQYSFPDVEKGTVTVTVEAGVDSVPPDPSAIRKSRHTER